MAVKTRYTDDELEEFRQIILAKLDKAKRDYDVLKSSITHEESNDTMDTSPHLKYWRKEPPHCPKRNPEDWHNASLSSYSIFRLPSSASRTRPTVSAVKQAHLSPRNVSGQFPMPLCA